MPARDRAVGVKTHGLAQTQRALGRIDKGMRRESLRRLREIAKQVRNTARDRYTPKLTGQLAKSLRYSASNRGATVSSNLPYAPVHEWGGTIRPKGYPILIPQSYMVGHAIEDEADDIDEQLGRIFDHLARRNGF